MSDRLGKYLSRHQDSFERPLAARGAEGIEQAVVIPALAENEYLFRTLDLLAANGSDELARTLVLCVINNRVDAPDGVRRNNAETLARLGALMHSPDTPLRLAYVDAASPGLELPARAGVGDARKLGLDWAARVLHEAGAPSPILLCLDADTAVAPDYLDAVRRHFRTHGTWAAVVAYEHELEGPDEVVRAIVCYETFLRYYVLGLRFAGSPYAFHSVGSTMACRADAYAAVGGMNRRQAGEDFYFLQKLAKTGGVETIRSTMLRPSPRPSDRVPFGTGQRVRRFLGGTEEEYVLYHPRTFVILRAWLESVRAGLDESGASLLEGARGISPALNAFLARAGFSGVWERLRANAPNSDGLLRQFHVWFDGFRTLKLVHHLRDSILTEEPMYDAVEALLTLMGRPSPFAQGECFEPGLLSWERLLHCLRCVDYAELE